MKESLQIKSLDPAIRVKILERAVPKMIKNFNNRKCKFYDELGISCEKCPLNTLEGGLHCDLRAVLAVLVDDMANESKKKTPIIPTEPFIEVDGRYMLPSKAIHKQDVAERFKGIL